MVNCQYFATFHPKLLMFEGPHLALNFLMFEGPHIVVFSRGHMLSSGNKDFSEKTKLSSTTVTKTSFIRAENPGFPL